HVALRAVRREWTQLDSGEWKDVDVDPQTCEHTSTAEPGLCTFTPKQGGVVHITATVADAEGRPNRSRMTVWVAGGKSQPSRGVSQESVTLIPDRKEYRAGDSAQLLVNAPFYPAEGVLTLRRMGLVDSRRFTMSGPSTTLAVAIDGSWV